MNKILKYRTTKGKWFEYMGTLPSNVTAILASEKMKMSDIEKLYPEQYLKLKALIIENQP